MAVGSVGSAFGVGGEVLKEDSGLSEDQAPHYARRRIRSLFRPFPLFPPQPTHGAMLGPISGEPIKYQKKP